MSWHIELNGSTLRRYRVLDADKYAYFWCAPEDKAHVSELATYETREAAEAWMARSHVFARGAVAVEADNGGQ